MFKCECLWGKPKKRINIVAKGVAKGCLHNTAFSNYHFLTIDDLNDIPTRNINYERRKIAPERCSASIFLIENFFVKTRFFFNSSYP